jgi:hypothetical protein
LIVGAASVLALSSAGAKGTNQATLNLSSSSWDPESSSFEIHYSLAPYGMAKGAEEGGWTIATSAVVRVQDTSFDLGTVSAPVRIAGVEEGKVGPDRAVLERVPLPWDRNGGTVSGVVEVTITPQLINPGGQDPLSRPEPGGSFTFTVRVLP